MKETKRGYSPKDTLEFGPKAQPLLNLAAEEIYYLINRGYDIKSCSTFIGNHYLLSERQRLVLARMLSPRKSLTHRQEKLLPPDAKLDTVHIDGFNTIITLEIALSGSLLIQGLDGTVRDIAGLRGTYRIIDKTEAAVSLILNYLDTAKVNHAVFYLDRPVSNSGRLKQLIEETAANHKVNVTFEIINDVDRILYPLANVITTDAIILDKCKSWYNLNRYIIEQNIEEPWVFKLNMNI